MRISDWSSDVCSSELVVVALEPAALDAQELGHRVELVVALVAHEVRPPEASPRPHGRVDEDRHEMPAKFTVAQSWPLESRHAAMPTLLNAGLWMLARWPRSEEHTSELQSLMRISYAVFCLKKKTTKKRTTASNDKVNNKHNNT